LSRPSDTWYGFQDKVWATVEYCKQHPHEIICFIDGFDSILLEMYPNDLSKLIDSDVGWTDRILYFFNPEKQYVTKRKSKEYTHRWMEGNKNTVLLIIALNLFV